MNVVRILTATVLMTSVACAGGNSGMSAADEVKQLITLYQEARPKFVVQKQEMIQAGSCSRATKVRKEIDRVAAEAAMSPDDTSTITKVQMELQQAEKECKAK